MDQNKKALKIVQVKNKKHLKNKKNKHQVAQKMKSKLLDK
jgi:hypothetical protein